MTTSLADPIAPDETLLPVSRGPRPTPPAPGILSAVSFGFANLRPLPEGAPYDFSGMVYDPILGLNIDRTTGQPSILLPMMASSTQRDTTEDHQKWTDSDTD